MSGVDMILSGLQTLANAPVLICWGGNSRYETVVPHSSSSK